MSRANLIFTFEDGVKLYGIFNGTIDSEWNFMCPTMSEAWDLYRKAYHSNPMDHVSLRPDCRCDGEPEPVSVENDYGWEETYPGKACRRCNVYLGADDKEERGWI